MSILRTHPFSRNIAATDYNPIDKKLVITFKPSGTSYRYHDVPAEVHAKLLEANATGKFFNQNIKGIYQYQKIEPESEDQQSPQ